METLALIFGTYALSAALIYSDGPWGILYSIRNKESIKDFGLFECFICLSFWVSLLLTYFMDLEWFFYLIGWGASIIIDKILNWLFTK